MSDRPSIWGLWVACSGLMYAGVPTAVPLMVSGSRLAAVTVGMGEPGRGLDLTQEALDPKARGELGVKELNRDEATVPEVVSQVDRRHPATADLAGYGVAVRDSGLETSEETGQAALPRSWPTDSRVSAMRGTLRHSPGACTPPCEPRCAWHPGRAPPCR